MGAPYAIDATRTPSMRRYVLPPVSRPTRARRDCDDLTLSSARFLVCSSLVHDVLRVVFPRVGLRRRAAEQGRKPETKEGPPQRCEGPPSAPPEVAHG